MANNTTKVLVTALDAIVNVNSLFTAIVFLGITFNTTSAAAATTDATSCKAGPTVVKQLVLLEVVSFSCYLFSSLLAQGLKLHISILNSANREDAMAADVGQFLLNFGVVFSGMGSVAGCFFLMWGMLNVIQIRLGLVSCERQFAFPAAVTMGVLVFSALGFYVFYVGYALKKLCCDRPVRHRHPNC